MEKSGSVASLPNDKREDGEILTDALSSVISRLNDAYSRLHKLEHQMNLHPRSEQLHPEEVCRYDQTLPTVLTILRAVQQQKNSALEQQVGTNCVIKLCRRFYYCGYGLSQGN